jgi:hypothetical protein
MESRGVGVVTVIEEIWKRKWSIISVWPYPGDPDGAVRMREGKLPQEDRVDHTE